MRHVDAHGGMGAVTIIPMLSNEILVSSLRKPTLRVLQQAKRKMNLEEDLPEAGGGHFRKAAARGWALLAASIYECLPLVCPKCGQPIQNDAH